MKEKILEFARERKSLVLKCGFIAVVLVLALMHFVGARAGSGDEFISAGSSLTAKDTGAGASDGESAAAGVSIGSASGATGGIEGSVSGSAGDGAESEEALGIYVDVDGAVLSPGLYLLDTGSRVNDAIEAAGGLAADGDLRLINRAEKLSDGDKLYIPFASESESQGVSSSSSAGSARDSSYYGIVSGKENADLSESASGGLVNINTASSAELQKLNGVGPSTAEKIIAFRDANGGFSKIEDLKKVSGIGDKTFLKLKDEICV